MQQEGKANDSTLSPSSDDIHDNGMTEINLDKADQISGWYISRLEKTRNSDGSQLWIAEEEEAYKEQRHIHLTEELGSEECVGLEGRN
eukprot:7422999-Ditylum_brightwellii.AAC.1